MLNEYEESLFSSARAWMELVPLAELIRKTEEQGELYDMVSYGTQAVSYPRPFVFAMQPQQGHPNSSKAATLSRVVCLYDNAGRIVSAREGYHLQPGDPAHGTIAGFVLRCRSHTGQPLPPTLRWRASARRAAAKLSRQEPILQEAAARVRRHTGLKQTEKHNRPLIVIVTKCDAWLHLIGRRSAS